jgi:hypothetical protein
MMSDFKLAFIDARLPNNRLKCSDPELTPQQDALDRYMGKVHGIGDAKDGMIWLETLVYPTSEGHAVIEQVLGKGTGTAGLENPEQMQALDEFKRLNGMIGIALGQFP